MAAASAPSGGDILSEVLARDPTPRCCGVKRLHFWGSAIVRIPSDRQSREPRKIYLPSHIICPSPVALRPLRTRASATAATHSKYTPTTVLADATRRLSWLSSCARASRDDMAAMSTCASSSLSFTRSVADVRGLRATVRTSSERHGGILFILLALAAKTRMKKLDSGLSCIPLPYALCRYRPIPRWLHVPMSRQRPW